MRKLVITVAIIGVAFYAFCQQPIAPQKPIRKPYFESASDSALFEQFYGSNFSALIMSIGTDKRKVDSLEVVRSSLLKKAKGTRYLYEPSADFTSWDNVKDSGHFIHERLISFSSDKYTKLPKELLHCKDLEAIELVNTNIRKIPRSLKRLTKLQTILIYSAKRNFKIGKNKALKILVVRGGKNPLTFAQLKNLERLDLSQCNLVTLPKLLNKNKKLKDLILNENSIDLTNSCIKENKSVTKIELKQNGLTEVPEGISLFRSLRILILNGNNISKVAPQISTLSKLEQLGFYMNKLTAIPEGVYHLSALKEIDLYYNQIERLDDHIGQLSNLEVLYLSNNKLISIPETIGHLTKLTGLYLSNNRLSDLPSSMKNLYDLKVLRLNNNYLTQVSRDLLKLNNLENIDISSNKITELPEEVASLSRLKLLVMMNNPWDSQSKERLPRFTEQLRKREIVVHAD